MYLDYYIDRGWFDEGIDFEVELTKEDVMFFIKTNIDFPSFESMDLDSWEEYLKEHDTLFIDCMKELHQAEFDVYAEELIRIDNKRKENGYE